MNHSTRPGSGVSSTDAGIVVWIDGVIVVAIMCLLFLHSVRDAHWQVEMQRCCAGQARRFKDSLLLTEWTLYYYYCISVEMHLHQLLLSLSQWLCWPIEYVRTQAKTAMTGHRASVSCFYNIGWCFLPAENTILPCHKDKHRLGCLFAWGSLYLVRGGATSGSHQYIISQYSFPSTCWGLLLQAGSGCAVMF